MIRQRDSISNKRVQDMRFTEIFRMHPELETLIFNPMMFAYSSKTSEKRPGKYQTIEISS